MAIATGVSLEEYLHTEYEPDCDYVDGALGDRNAGYLPHSRTLTQLMCVLYEKTRALPVKVLPILSLRVSPTRIRVIDICLLSDDDPDEIPSHPPHLCIEVLDRRDTFSPVQSCIDDYLAFGVPLIWIVDPLGMQAWTITADGVQRCAELRWNGVSIRLSEIFTE
jgi:Uma2 family endonuclease